MLTAGCRQMPKRRSMTKNRRSWQVCALFGRFL